jgi:hypothetical protein
MSACRDRLGPLAWILVAACSACAGCAGYPEVPEDLTTWFSARMNLMADGQTALGVDIDCEPTEHAGLFEMQPDPWTPEMESEWAGTEVLVLLDGYDEIPEQLMAGSIQFSWWRHDTGAGDQHTVTLRIFRGSNPNNSVYSDLTVNEFSVTPYEDYAFEAWIDQAWTEEGPGVFVELSDLGYDRLEIVDLEVSVVP